MKKSILCLLLVMLAFSNIPARAQDAPAATSCDLPALQKLIDTTIESLTTLKQQTDPKQVMDDLQVITSLVGMYRSACDGLTFSDDKQVVIGPVTIPAGIYRAKLTTVGYAAVQVDALDGKCGVGARMSANQHLFIVSKGDADAGAEALFKSEGCTALLTVENVTKPWQLTFEGIAAK